MALDDDIKPDNVVLRDFDDYTGLRQDVYDTVKTQLSNTFPQTYGDTTLHLVNVDYVDPDDYDNTEQKEALLKDKFLARRLRGEFVLTDKEGQELDRKKLTIMKVPHLTNRGTWIHGGNEYTTKHQSRLLPGAYTRVQNNGELETQFNVKTGGQAFRVGVDPANMQYRMRIKQANLHLYSLLHDIGVDDKTLEASWGKGILDQNRAKYDRRVFDKAFERLVPAKLRKDVVDEEQKKQLIRDALENNKISKRVAQVNLPNMFDRRKSASWLEDGECMEKLGQAVLEKAARLGAGVLFKTKGDKYLLEKNHADGSLPKELVGKLRPAGGGKSKRDKDLRDTIIREIHEEFGLPEEKIRGKIKLLGYINEGDFKDCAMFEMTGHGLKPGRYQASNSKNEFVDLVESTLDDPDYIGKKPDELRPFKDPKHPGNNMIKDASAFMDALTGMVKSGSVLAPIKPNGEGNKEPFTVDVIRTLALFLNVHHEAGLPLDLSGGETKQLIKQFLDQDPSVNQDVLALSQKVASYEDE